MKSKLSRALKKATGLDVVRQEARISAKYPDRGDARVTMRFGADYVTQTMSIVNPPSASYDVVVELPGQATLAP